MTKILLSNFYSSLKVKRIISILKYNNNYIDILFILIHQGILRGFYFEYFFEKKYIMLLFKHNYIINLTIKLNKKHMQRNFNIFIWRTNFGILVNIKRKWNHTLMFKLS